ncbi:Fic/DOC family protein [Chakrabartyella piscis]|uniref:Fic/DOC family protein n=1 Tax=Chakrabartyella piscis TaxID=2918914 RepID=UPI00295888EC|nr:Fic family protein [Chakrabartyella piscis]
MSDGFNKYDVYVTNESIYCYRGTNVLRNKFKIKDNTTLKQIEDDITTIRQLDLLDADITGRFTASHLCKIHKYIFGDIYSFAGHFRKESISKGNTVFENPNTIKVKLEKLLILLKNENYLKNLDETAFIERLAYYFAELNYLHPFREGNGRATREFIRQLLWVNGYVVDWTAVEADYLLDIMEDSVFDVKPLVVLLQKCIKPMNI